MKNAIEPKIETHGVVWRNEECLDAGIFRATNTYSEAGYDKEYYGIRKYIGLKPNSVYSITIQVSSGTTEEIFAAREWEEWEYGIDEDVDYTGLKLVSEERNANDRYGFSVSSTDNYLAVGSPNYESLDENSFALPQAGQVEIYERPEPTHSGQKAPWNFKQKLQLPDGFRRDYYDQLDTGGISFPGLPNIPDRQWHIGQEGREFGYSVATHSGDRDIVVVGGPGSDWSRTFDDISLERVTIGVMIITDEFVFNSRSANAIQEKIRYWNKLYKYYASDPSDIDFRVIICQPTGIFTAKEQAFLPGYMDHYLVNRNNTGLSSADMLQQLKDAFLATFPEDLNARNNGLPPIFGIYVDDSGSLGREAMEPAVDDFITYYESYTLANGVKDIFNNPLPGSVYEFIPSEGSLSGEDWFSMTSLIIDKTIDYNRLLEEDTLKFITEAVGAEYVQVETTEFNLDPKKGGRVYIFEKEGDEFNVIQEIKSANESSLLSSDRFGHDVAISKNGEVICIGSPYASDCVSVFEFNEDAKTDLYTGIGSWLIVQNSKFPGVYAALISGYDSYRGTMSPYESGKKVYLEDLNKTQKFQIRLDLKVEEYKQIFSYSHGNIPYIGTWGFIPQKFAASPRLGYSVDVNEDGSTIVVGSPTDSFNEFDDYNVWYMNDGYAGSGYLPDDGMWASNINAGSVRVFNSRKYYEHNKAVEFTKFGNLGVSLNSNPGHYDDLGDILNMPFEKTQFSDIEIPKDAGLAFIITPEVDAVSDEIIENIKDWLELGDRTLVLVGDDPVWEENGIYAKSNKIINKILSKLDSRMRIEPARYKHHSLQECTTNGRPNALNSGVPSGARDTLPLLRQNIYCNGVGDIRITIPGYLEKSPCDKLNPKCEMWLRDYGDLRASWTVSCFNDRGETIFYEKNWPLQFGSYEPKCSPKYEASIRRPNEEPIPVIVAGEYLPARTEIIPAVSGVQIVRTPVYVQEITSHDSLKFVEDHEDGVLHFWSEESGSISSSSLGNFFNPDEFDGRNAIAQKTAELLEVSPKVNQRVVQLEFPIVAKEVLNGSDVYIIASLCSEDEGSLTRGNDDNVNFYLNLVQEDCSTKGRIIQLGGWTGRDSFASGYAPSLLYKLFSVTGNLTQENWNLNIPESYNVCWITNPTGLPNNDQINDIKDWMSSGNKKLVITYDSTISSITTAGNLMELLGLASRPLFSESNDSYIYGEFATFSFSEDESVIGCGDREVTKFYSSDSTVEELFVPVVGSESVIKYNGQYREYYYTPQSKHFMKTGILEIEIPVESDSGYRIVVKTVSETPRENEDLSIHISGAFQSPNSLWSSPEHGILNFDGNNLVVSNKVANFTRDILYGQIGIIKETNLDVRSFRDSNTISVLIEGNKISDPKEYDPRTIRVLSVEIYDLLIEDVKNITVRSVLSHFDIVETPFSEEERSVEYPEVLRAIHSDNTRYCSGSIDPVLDSNACKDKGGKEIADGPVVVAEEPEHFSAFTNGSKRSSIVLIADSSIIQGSCDYYRNENAGFINSLYPSSPSVSSSTGQGRVFEYSQKLLPPNAFSPGKVMSVTTLNEVELAQKFNNGNVPSSSSTSVFYDGYSNFHPEDVIRTKEPETDLDFDKAIDKFETKVSFFGNINPRFKFNGMEDAGLDGGIPSIVDVNKIDFFDIDQHPSGYPGGLFGYSVSISNDLISVGSPFSGFYNGQKTWDEIVATPGDLYVNEDGGRGEVYCYKKTNKGVNVKSETLPWELTDKINHNGSINDLFGYDVDIDVEFMCVGSPKHNYDTLHIHKYENGEFLRKEFDSSFDIPTHEYYDMGDEGVRTTTGSGVLYNDIGSVYTYEHRIDDWRSKTKSWEFAEKLNSAGYNNREPGDMFGRSVSMNRSYRTDSDYTLCSGSTNHSHGISISDPAIIDSGSVHVYDAMLRRQPPLSNLGGEITAIVGLTGENGSERDSTEITIVQNLTGGPKVTQVTGLGSTNDDGEIFLEVYGSENAERGFITHRPYIQWVNGKIASGEKIFDHSPMFTSGSPYSTYSKMNLYAKSQISDIVYNTLEVFVNSSYSDNDSLHLYVNSLAPIMENDSVDLVCGSGLSFTDDILSLRVRGK